MEKPSFDEVVRGLLVFLKGQIPAMQSRGSTEEMIRHMQNVVIYLRNSILQLEGASQFNPKQTAEFKELQASLESVKKANQKFEESLFLEMGKNQKLTEEMERIKSLQRDSGDIRKELQEAKDRIKALTEEIERYRSQQTASGSLNKEFLEGKKAWDQERKHWAEEKTQWMDERDAYLEENKHLQDLVKELKNSLEDQKQKLKSQEDTARVPVSEKFALERELKKVLDDKKVLAGCLETAQRELKEAKLAIEKNQGTMPHLQDKVTTQDETIHLLRTSQLQMEKDAQELRKALLEMKRQLGEKQVLFESSEVTIKALEDRVNQMKREAHASTAGEVIRNVNASYEAKIAFLEKALEEAKGRLQEKEVLLGQAPAKVENLLKEKALLEQRLIDMEAIVRRISANRRKSLQEDGTNIEFGPDECVFFFEFFMLISTRLEKSLEYNDLRFKAEEALSILLKSHALEPIPTLGAIFLDTHHKPVKAFYSTLLEDGTVIRETVKGFRFRDHVIQRAHVWIVKSRFSCSSCSAQGRPQDSFCPKCGLELCAPEGTPKRKLPSLPTDPSVCVPLSESFVKQEQFLKAMEIIDYSLKDYPEDSDLKKKRTQIVQHLQEKERY